MAVNSCEKPFRYVHSLGLPGLLENLAATLVVTTYQAGKLALFRARDGRLSMLPRTFEQAMGMAVAPNRMAIGTRYQVWFLENDQTLAAQIDPAARHDACFLPRYSHVTGNIHVHEMAWGQASLDDNAASGGTDELWIVNTLFSCLCTLDRRHSFVPRWRPRFITQLAPQDRCHLNGLAMQGGKPSYVTLFDETDAPDGWRPRKATAGCVVDVKTGETVARGLSMPHSPRWYDGKLWVLDSGRGRVARIDPISGVATTVAQLPGYTRGLAFCEQYAFVGLSKIRETATFGGVPIAEHREELKCGVWVIDSTTGSVSSFLEFQQDVDEIFDVQVLAGTRNPSVIGLSKDTVQGAFVIPPEGELP